PEHRGDRAVRGRSVLVSFTLQGTPAKAVQDGSDQHGLADARLAGDQQQGRAARLRLGEEVRQLGPFTLPIDELVAHARERVAGERGAGTARFRIRTPRSRGRSQPANATGLAPATTSSTSLAAPTMVAPFASFSSVMSRGFV